MSNECTKKNSSYVFPSLDLLNPVEKLKVNGLIRLLGSSAVSWNRFLKISALTAK